MTTRRQLPFDAVTIQHHLARMAENRGRTGQLYVQQQRGVPLSAILRERGPFAAALARDLADRTYTFSPARLRRLRVGDKEREISVFEISDFLVHYCAAELVQTLSASVLSEHLYSYLPGRSYVDGAVALARALRAHVTAVRDVKQRGVYVLRRDVRAYYDSVRVGRDAPLWTALRALLDRAELGAEDRAYAWSVVEACLRPTLTGPAAEGARCLTVGIPTGSPLSPVIANVYLSAMDHDLGAIPGGFYARYGDDFVFAHPDASAAREAAHRMEGHMARSHLSLHPNKIRDMYLTGAGKRSEAWAEAQPTTSVDFLGFDVSFRGTLRLRKKSLDALMADLRSRARVAARAVPREQRIDGGRGESWERIAERGRLVCSVVNDGLDPRSGLSGPGARRLLDVVTDRGALKDLDYRIARMVATATSGDPSVRAFRRVPYRTMRESWGLRSVLHARDLVR